MIKTVLAFVIAIVFIGWPTHLALSQTNRSTIKFFDNMSAPIVKSTVSDRSLTYEELRAIFTLNKTHWSDGQKITVVILPRTNLIQRRFIWEYLGMSASSYQEIITARAATNKPIPIVVQTESMMLSKIRSTNGAIGIIGSDIVISAERGIRVIKIL